MYAVGASAAATLAERLNAPMDESEEAEPASEMDSLALSALQAALTDQQRRLTVACTQMAEFAGAKEEEASQLKTQILQLAPLVSGRPDFEALLARMHSQVVGAGAEAAALARTHREEAAKASRGAGGGAGGAHAASFTADAPAPGCADPLDEDGADADVSDAAFEDAATSAAAALEDGGDFTERARYIPLRLSMKERQRLRLLEAALSVSEYTDKVDVISYTSKTKRINAQLLEICAILCGLVLAVDYRTGQELLAEKDFKQNESFFQLVFEIGRRHKIMNPDKMRTEYGKLVYLLQDSQLPDVQQLLEFKIVTPLKTVHAFLASVGCLDMLRDPAMAIAVGEIATEGRTRGAVAKDIKLKERAREHLAKKYSSVGGASADELLTCLYSVGDNAAYLRFNRDPVDRMIWYLRHWFKPREPEERAFSLAIALGAEGARLSHSHERQYAYVLQSLTLWREVAHDMFKLWYLAEEDLLREGNHYRLTDTGQGLNRVQQAPAVGRAIHALLARCQQRLGAWVGSSVVHLGDHNVPNALMFIDKYTQVPRILAPVVLAVEQIDALCEDAGLAAYINGSFGGPERLKKTILTDFFRHAFDGSGADNFFDAGSCIDGRLTSAWNWCSQIEKKAYYPVFKLAGFNGFDGDWQK